MAYTITCLNGSKTLVDDTLVIQLTKGLYPVPKEVDSLIPETKNLVGQFPCPQCGAIVHSRDEYCWNCSYPLK